MNTPEKENRPGDKAGAASAKINQCCLPDNTPSLPDPADMLQGVHVVMVAYKISGEIRFRRRFYLNLNAAQRAVDRAVERGQAASIILCRLAPSGPVEWESGGVR